MAKYEEGDLVPFGSTLVRTPGGWVPDDNEATTCGHCRQDLTLIEDEDEAGHPTARYGDPEHHAKNGVQCCSQACAALYDLDVRTGLECLAAYLDRLGSSLPPIGVGFSRMNAAAYVRGLLDRHTYALTGAHRVEEVIKECIQ